MIYGAKEYKSKDHHYSQYNNPSEEMFKKLGIKGYLESCGPTAAVSCLAVLGCDMEASVNTYFQQPEAVAMDWFHDSKNYDKMRAARPDIDPRTFMNNRVPQDYPSMVSDVFSWGSLFTFVNPAKTMSRAIIELKQGNSVQVALSNPGHYISLVAYDEELKEIIYNDSHGMRAGNVNGGYNEKILASLLAINLEPYLIIYYKNGQIV